MPNLRWGIKTSQQHTTYEAIVPIWKEADQNPVFEHAWLFDHFNPIAGSVEGPCYEGWTMLAALAAQTERIRLGLMVAGNTYRHPAIHAHTVATVDLISNGRVDFGVGAGWNVYEHESMGIPLYEPAERIKRLGEACALTKLLFTQDVTDFDGTYYQLKEARLEPKPVQKPWPPFVIGGGGEQLTLRVVARHADVWNHGGTDVEVFKHKVEVLARPLRRHRPRSERDRALGPGAHRLRRHPRLARRPPTDDRRRRHPLHPDAALSLSRRASSQRWPTRSRGSSARTRRAQRSAKAPLSPDGEEGAGGEAIRQPKDHPSLPHAPHK